MNEFEKEFEEARNKEAEQKLNAFDAWKHEHLEELMDAFEIENGDDPLEHEDEFNEFCEEKYKEE